MVERDPQRAPKMKEGTVWWKGSRPLIDRTALLLEGGAFNSRSSRESLDALEKPPSDVLAAI